MKLSKKILAGALAFLFAFSGVFATNTSYAKSSKLTSAGAYKNKDDADTAAREIKREKGTFEFADGWGYYVGDAKPYDENEEPKIFKSLDAVWEAAFDDLKNNPDYDVCTASGFMGNFYYDLVKVDYKKSLGAYKTKSEASAAGEKALASNPGAYDLKVYQLYRDSNIYSYTFKVDPSKAKEDKDKVVITEKSKANNTTKEKLEEAIKNSKKTIENAEFVIKKYPNTLKGVIPEVEALIAKSKALIKEAESRLAKYN